MSGYCAMELTYENAEISNPAEKKQNWLAAFGLQAVDNSPFEKNAKFFRNVVLNVNRENKFLIKFFENILHGKKHRLQNRKLHIHWREV